MIKGIYLHKTARGFDNTEQEVPSKIFLFQTGWMGDVIFYLTVVAFDFTA